MKEEKWNGRRSVSLRYRKLNDIRMLQITRRNRDMRRLRNDGEMSRDIDARRRNKRP